MSIKASTLLNNSATNDGGALSLTRTPSDSSWVSLVIPATTTPATLLIGSITTPHEISLKNAGGDKILIGFDGTTWPLQIAAGESQLLVLQDGRVWEKSQVTPPTSTVTSALAGDYFSLDGNSGTWAVWFTVDGSGSYAGPGVTNLLPVALTTGDSQAAVCAAIAAAMNASTAFTSDFTFTVASPIITITDILPASRTHLDVTTATGFAGVTLANGAAWTFPVVNFVSAGNSVLQYAVASA